jgi:hypothetical protein
LLQLVAILECPLNPSGTLLATSLLICGQVGFAQSRARSRKLPKLVLLIKLLTSFSLLQVDQDAQHENDGNADENTGSVANERGQVRILRELSNLTTADEQTVQQMSQLTDPDSPDLCSLLENLLKESGLSPHATNYGDRSKRAKLQRTPPKSLPQPTFTPFSISNGAVKARTGFVSMFSLLSFVVVVCNGDVVQMMKKESSMTWFEEWFLFFQWERGHKSTPLTLLQDYFKMSKSTICRVLWHKLNAVLEARKRWPRFAMLEEDVNLMSAW